MKENKIPSAEEFIKNKYNVNTSSEVAVGGLNLTKLLITFAKLHVKAALEAAVENAEAFCNYERDFLDGTATVDKDSIQSAYPEELIK